MKKILYFIFILYFMSCSSSKKEAQNVSFIDFFKTIDTLSINDNFCCVKKSRELEEISDCILHIIDEPKYLKNNEYRLLFYPPSAGADDCHIYRMVFYDNYAWISKKYINNFDIGLFNFPTFRSINYKVQVYEIDSIQSQKIKNSFNNIFNDTTYLFKKELYKERIDLLSASNVFILEKNNNKVFFKEKAFKNKLLEIKLLNQINDIKALLNKKI
jgi:hypothetical protein